MTWAITKDCRGVNGTLSSTGTESALMFSLTNRQEWFLLTKGQNPA